MEQDISKIKQEIETRLQLVVTLAIFFPTLISVFLSTSEMAEKQVSGISLIWTGMVGVLLFDYVFFAIFKSKLTSWVLRLVNWSLLIGVALFIFPTIIIATSQPDKPSSLLNYISLVVSLRGLPLMPFVVLGFLVLGLLIYFIKTETKLKLPKWLV